jgi:N-acyl-D-amino-acid deacylase
MKNIILLILVVIVTTACSTENQPKKVDVLISGGSVFLGNESGFEDLDIGISGEKIVFLGNDFLGEATQTVDASGLIVSPGFIDMHTHLGPLMNIPDAKSHLMQGSTTALGGPDGGGPWPFTSYLDSIDNISME